MTQRCNFCGVGMHDYDEQWREWLWRGILLDKNGDTRWYYWKWPHEHSFRDVIVLHSICLMHIEKKFMHRNIPRRTLRSRIHCVISMGKRPENGSAEFLLSISYFPLQEYRFTDPKFSLQNYEWFQKRSVDFMELYNQYFGEKCSDKI